MSDARRRAEEALAEYDRLWGAAHATNAYGRAVVGLASALRALLAAGPEAKASVTARELSAILARVACGDSDYADARALDAELKRRHPGHDRIAELESLLRECNAVCLCGCPDSESRASCAVRIVRTTSAASRTASLGGGVGCARSASESATR